jgi:excinuclease ABC subunit A
VLKELQRIGNTVVVVEHDEEIIRSADYIIDMGPLAGRLGGEVVYQGKVAELEKKSDSFTVNTSPAKSTSSFLPPDANGTTTSR